MSFSAYLSFPGTCEDAFAFYAKVFGGKVLMMLRNSDTPAAEHVPANWKNKVIHGRLEFNGTLLMGVDESPEHYKPMAGVSIAAEIKTPAEAERVFKELSEEGSVPMPITETFFAHRFGILTDKFGINWMVNCEKKMG